MDYPFEWITCPGNPSKSSDDQKGKNRPKLQPSNSPSQLILNGTRIKLIEIHEDRRGDDIST